ncbi:MAG: VTT domain-containing protein [Athalassotoga sp.]|uniref:VTT domain-containing protein n=1 Tax=Athalassotoga sp. TaxID=2022597 RepID=UPI00175786BC|nr:hypothetical protein [Mesoaciditoga lauensis]
MGIHTILNSLSDFSVWAINSAGYIGIFFTMVLEGFSIPLPSEVILPLGGYIASKGSLNVLGVVLAGSLGGTVGSIALYYVSMFFGRGFIKKWGKYVLISEKHLDSMERWFENYGNFTVFTTRLLPIVRGLVAIPAGISKMNIWSYALYTFLGSFIWALILVYFGFQLGLSGLNMDVIWLIVLILVGVTFGIYFGYKFLKRYVLLFNIIVNVILWSFLGFFVFFALYEAYFPISAHDLNYSNIKAIENIKGDFSFYAVGNTFYNVEYFDSFSSATGTNKFIVDTGNMVYSGDLSKYKILLNDLKRLKIPFLAVPGPRDLTDGGYANFYHVFGSYEYTFHVNKTFFVVLNNSNGKITQSQFDWLSDRLSRASTYTQKFLVMHTPAFWMKGSKKMDENISKNLQDILLKSKVNLVISTGPFNYSETPVPYVQVGGRNYAIVNVGNEISVTHGALPSLNSNFNQVMQNLSVYVYTYLVMEWPIIGIISIIVLLLWFVYKRYKITVKIERK